MVSSSSLSVSGAAYNVAMTSIGIGLVGMPVAMAEAGYLVGVFMVFLCGSVSAWTARILLDCAEMADQKLGRKCLLLEDVGLAAGGKLGQIAVAAMNYLMLTGATALLIIVMGESTYHLGPQISRTTWYYIWMMAMLPVGCLRTMKHVGLLSTWLGIPSCAVVVALVCVAGSSEAAENEHEYDMVFEKFSDLATSFANLCFAFAANCTLIQIRADMSEPKKAGKAVIIGFGILIGSFSVISLAGYFGWGRSIKEMGFDTISEAVYHSAGGFGPWMGQLLAVMLIVLCVSHYAVVLNPVSQGVDRALGLQQKLDQLERRRKGSKEEGVEEDVWVVFGLHTRAGVLMTSCALRCCLVVITGMMAVFIPTFMAFVDIIGAVTCNAVQLLFPVVLYVALKQHEHTSILGVFNSKRGVVKAIGLAGVLVMFGLGASLGLMDAIKRMAKAIG